MTAYAHLAHFYRECTNHYGRKIHNLGDAIDENVCTAMYSISTAFPLPDIEGIFALIKNGGAKAAGKHEFRISGNKFKLTKFLQHGWRIRKIQSL